MQCLLALPLVLYAFSPSVRPEPPMVLKVAALAFAVRFLPANFGMTTAYSWLLTRATSCSYARQNVIVFMIICGFAVRTECGGM